MKETKINWFKKRRIVKALRKFVQETNEIANKLRNIKELHNT